MFESNLPGTYPDSRVDSGTTPGNQRTNTEPTRNIDPTRDTSILLATPNDPIGRYGDPEPTRGLVPDRLRLVDRSRAGSDQAL